MLGGKKSHVWNSSESRFFCVIKKVSMRVFLPPVCLAGKAASATLREFVGNVESRPHLVIKSLMRIPRGVPRTLKLERPRLEAAACSFHGSLSVGDMWVLWPTYLLERCASKSSLLYSFIVTVFVSTDLGVPWCGGQRTISSELWGSFLP